MISKLNGISELLALFPLPPPLAESAVNHRSGRDVAYATNVRRAHASKAFANFGRPGDYSVHVLARARFTALMRTEKRRTYSDRCTMVCTITYHACSLVRFVGVYS